MLSPDTYIYFSSDLCDSLIVTGPMMDQYAARKACRKHQFVVESGGNWYIAKEADANRRAVLEKAAGGCGLDKVVSGVTIENGFVFVGETPIGVKVGEAANLHDAMNRSVGGLFPATTDTFGGDKAAVVLVRGFRDGEKKPLSKAEKERQEAARQAAAKLETAKETALEILTSGEPVRIIAQKLGVLVSGFQGEDRRSLVASIRELMGTDFTLENKNILLAAMGEPIERQLGYREPERYWAR